MSGKLQNDLIGQEFGSLTVLHRSNDSGNGKKPVVKWDCRCECGSLVSVKSDSLLSGHTHSCGCKKIKHGYSNKERLYQTWKNMKRRCNDPTNKRYSHYGGRGITVCSEWESDYSTFRQWAMMSGYDDVLTIDRINVDGGYSPANCRWVDAKTQANNVSRNRVFEYNGKKLTMAELADLLKLSYPTLQHRVENGWSMERIAATPQRGMEQCN